MYLIILFISNFWKGKVCEIEVGCIFKFAAKSQQRRDHNQSSVVLKNIGS